MNVLSFVLFGRRDRYWNCLPAALIGFAELYPGWRLRLHCARDALGHPLFPFVRDLAERSGRIDLVAVDGDYAGTEPTLWRMLPLRDPAVETVLCRDLDSAPSSRELRAVRVFRRGGSPPVHGIRGHRLHNGLLLAGLCGFKTRLLGFLRREIGSFEHYRAIHRRLGLAGEWGCDQRMLHAALARHADRILDSALGAAPALPWPVVSVAPEVYEAVGLDDLPGALLALCDGISAFPGQPQDDTRPALRRMLALDTPVARACREALARRLEAARRYLSGS